jgi:MFS family permease
MGGKLYRHYVLGILTLVYTMNYLDRGLITLLLQPIKEDLQLSDTQLGFLTGIAFGLFYATCGLPIARWADRGNRATITSIAIGLWGLTVMSSLFVRNFLQLVLARTAAGIGEAGCMPPSYSLLGDYFPAPAERSRAMGVYWLANPLSGVISFMVGGWLNARYGWRITFVLMGMPALLVALAVKLSVAEPRIHRSQAPTTQSLGMADVLRVLWCQRSSRHLCIALVLLYTMWLGLGPWYAAFMMRSHGMAPAELGIWFGAILGVGGIVGVLGGGYVSARWFAGDERRQLRLSAFMAAATVPFFVLFLLLPHRRQALCALLPLVVVSNFVFAPIFSLMQRLVVDEMRATMLAVVMLLANLIGLGVGPQLVGILSDVLMPALSQESLRYAMLAVSMIALWGAYHLWLAGQTVGADLRRVVTWFEEGIPEKRNSSKVQSVADVADPARWN